MSAKEALIKKLGSYEAYKAYLRALGSKGGKASKSPPNHPTRFDNLDPELVRQAAAAGGRKSRRKPLDLDKR